MTSWVCPTCRKEWEDVHAMVYRGGCEGCRDAACGIWTRPPAPGDDPVIVVHVAGGLLTAVESSDPRTVVIYRDQDNIEAGDPAPVVPPGMVYVW